MARRPRAPVFLERSSYRQRRLRDAARLLPCIGLVLWMIPLLWPKTAPGQVATSDALIYLFVVWGGLVIAALLMSRLLRHDPDVATGADAPENESG